MLKVLIIDDEPMIREGLKTIIGWDDYGFCVCGEAADGEEGLAKIRELEPDLMIVDLKMPGMGGIEMISRSRAWNTQAKAIILSGCSDFEYARKALEVDVKSYLLKPIERPLLIDKVKSIHEAIMKEKKIKEHFDRSVQLSRDKLFEELANGQMEAFLEDNVGDPYAFNFPWDYYQVILAESDTHEDLEEYAPHTVCAQIVDYVLDRDIGLVFGIGMRTVILSKTRIYESSLKMLEPIADIARDIAGMRITFAVGTGTKELSGICESYRNACGLLARKFIYGPGNLIVEKKGCRNFAGEGGGIAELFDMEELSGKLFISIDVNNTSGVRDLLEVVRACFADSGLSEDRIKNGYIRIYTGVLNRLLAGNLCLKSLSGGQDSVFAEITGKKCLQQLHEFVSRRLISISNELAGMRPDRMMDKIIDHIGRNYGEDIKLETLAEVFNYNSAYLGQMFKNHTGRYFNTYLDEVRINKAKQLLKEGLKVYEVARMVGYDNVGYFHNKFKKYTGMQPAAYKSQVTE